MTKVCKICGVETEGSGQESCCGCEAAKDTKDNPPATLCSTTLADGTACRKEITTDTAFCIQCEQSDLAATKARHCSNCKIKLQPDSRFCHNCGTPISAGEPAINKHPGNDVGSISKDNEDCQATATEGTKQPSENSQASNELATCEKEGNSSSSTAEQRAPEPPQSNLTDDPNDGKQMSGQSPDEVAGKSSFISNQVDADNMVQTDAKDEEGNIVQHTHDKNTHRTTDADISLKKENNQGFVFGMNPGKEGRDEIKTQNKSQHDSQTHTMPSRLGTVDQHEIGDTKPTPPSNVIESKQKDNGRELHVKADSLRRGDQFDDERSTSVNTDQATAVSPSEGTSVDPADDNQQTTCTKEGSHKGDSNNGSKVTSDDRSPTPSGTRQNKNERKLRIKFHVLVSKDFNLAKEDNVIMVIGHDHYGGWNPKKDKWNCLKVIRETDTYFVMEIDIECDSNMTFLQYKYAVVKGKGKPKFEKHINYGHKDKHHNRYIHLNGFKQETNWFEVTHHQYDGFVVPNEDSKIKKLWNYVKGKWGGDKGLAHISMDEFCKPYPGKNEMSVQQIIEHYKRVISCLTKVYVHHWHQWSDRQTMTHEIMEPILTRILGENTSDPEKRIQNACLVILLSQEFTTPLRTEDNAIMCKAFKASQTSKGDGCIEMDILKSSFDIKELKSIVNGLRAAMRNSVRNKKDPSWLYGIAMYHFLTGRCTPYEALTKDITHDSMSPRWWGIDDISNIVHDFKEQYGTWSIALQQILDELSPYFTMDYLLPRTIMASLRVEEIEEAILSYQIPLDVCCANLIYFLKALPLTEYKSVHTCMASMLKTLEMYSVQTYRSSKIHCWMTYRIAGQMFSQCKSIGTLLISVHIALQTISDFSIRWDNDQEGNHELSSGTADDYQNLIEKVVYGIGLNLTFTRENSIEQIIQWWNELSSVDLACKTFQDRWLCTLKTELKNMMDDQLLWSHERCKPLIGIYCTDGSGYTQTIRECIENAILRVLEGHKNINLKDQTADLLTEQQTALWTLLSDSLIREWNATEVSEDNEKEMLLNVALKWKPFLFLLHLSRAAPHPEGIECMGIIGRIVSVLQYYADSIAKGTVRVGTLVNFYQVQTELVDLLHEVLQIDRQKILQDVDICWDQLQRILKTVEHLTIFRSSCYLLSEVDFKVIDGVLEKQKDRHLIPLNELSFDCDFHQGKKSNMELIPTCVREILPEMEKLKTSNILKGKWQSTCKTEMKSCSSLEDIKERIWTPVHKWWKATSKRIIEGSFFFQEMDCVLRDISDRNTVYSELLLMDIPDDIARERIDQLGVFKEMQTYVRAAVAILKFAKTYNLEGDFNAIQKVVETHKDSEFQMKDFPTNVKEEGCVLVNLTKERIECLEALTQSSRLVKWLRDTMKTSGLRELKVFTELASMTAGDDQLKRERVMCFDACVSGFAPLIFDLKTNMGYQQVLRLCEQIWTELEQNPRLPEQMSNTNKILQWFKDVEKSHGSVEKSSLTQCEMINSSGRYIISGKVNKDCEAKNLDNVISLVVEEDSENGLTTTYYNFRQLQDLQSRLMLVAGKDERTNEGVNRFTMIFDSIIRLAKVYIKLSCAGCVLFRHWKAEFLCNTRKKVCVIFEFGQGIFKGHRNVDDRQNQLEDDELANVIPGIADFMDKCLKKWLHYIKQNRTTLKQLNFFTIDQLVLLQEELVKVGGDSKPIKYVYPLLSSVKKDCTIDDLIAAIDGTTTFLQTGEKIDDDEGEHSGEQERETDEEEENNLNDREKQNRFIDLMEESGYDRELARKALNHVDPEDIEEGITWCMEYDGEDEHGENVDNTDESEQELSMTHQGGQTLWRGLDQPNVSLQYQIGGIVEQLQSNDENSGLKDLLSKLDKVWEGFLGSITSNVCDYLSLKHLGMILESLAEQDDRSIHRVFPAGYEERLPNLIVCPSYDVLTTALTLYANDRNSPLPLSDEVLICTPETTLDQVDIFWMRAIFGSNGKIHCLVNADLLDFDVGDVAEKLLHGYMDANNMQDSPHAFRLFIVCGSQNEYRSQIIASLDKYRRFAPRVDMEKLQRYVKDNLVKQSSNEVHSAAVVDFDASSVRVIKSARSGVGKTLYKSRREEDLLNLQSNQTTGKTVAPGDDNESSVSVPIHTKNVDTQWVIEKLLNHTIEPGKLISRIFHLDIAQEVEHGVDNLLFNLIVLGCLTDNRGYVWRRSPNDLYLIETVPLLVQSAQDMREGQQHYFHRMLHILPSVTCRGPLESLAVYEGNPPRDHDASDQLFDRQMFQSDHVQRPFQYLLKFDEGSEDGKVEPEIVKGNQKLCLQTLVRHCGVKDPSWSELRNFIWFLNVQLKDCEDNNFLGDAAAGDLPGFSKFVLKSLLQMSMDFSTRSLNMSEESPGLTTLKETDYADENEDVDEEYDESEESDETVLRQFELRRTWECSPHPYIFFNPDKTFTFLGFYINPATGALIDGQTGAVLEKNVMDKRLFYALKKNGVPMRERFDDLSRIGKLDKLCSVIGMEHVHDPDDTYELTTDNVKKILAIYMRFRCDIPVLIMGETGCGKTRLIKFLCALQVPPWKKDEVQNMVLMKVHGGTTHSDIIEKTLVASELADENAEKHGSEMFTVLFFDEANTTECIGLIKEILCDKTVHGDRRGLSKNLKIVAACNPYRKHSDELIKQLEQAGLGYHVDADETEDRFGRVPMRRLVYRVQPLPKSLLPLVWDFGQLNIDVEESYIKQMVLRHRQAGMLPSVPNLDEVLSSILTASQAFTRKQKDECKFVSLRDVERTLLVMSWFYKQREGTRTLFNLMNVKLQSKEERSEEGDSNISHGNDESNNDIDDDDGDNDDDDADDNIDDDDDNENDDAADDREDDGEADDPEDNADDGYAAADYVYRTAGDETDNTEIRMEKQHERDVSLDDLTRSLVLALGVCYHACLTKRRQYRNHVAYYFTAPFRLPQGSKQMASEIYCCQDVFLDNIDLAENIAKNIALKENVFMMIICIQLRIPLFLVGKPGSSKSLAKTIVSDAMEGKTSKNDFFKDLKQTRMVSFQCSPLSTADAIVGTFVQCAEFQKDKDLDTFVSVVVLDEVGLAEDSPRMPLKTLHPLLEDGSSGDDSPENYKKVAFIGISNWALDPAKMNRGILVQRQVPDLTELTRTARDICSKKDNVYQRIADLVEPMAKSYLEIFKKASTKKREFFGLRDFYSLVKMVYAFAVKSGGRPTWPQMMHAVQRNFGGLEGIDPSEYFSNHLYNVMPINDKSKETDPVCSSAGLIRACLEAGNEINSDTRYLLLLTENYGALSILQQQILSTERGIKPITLFGSSFRNDQEYTQVCRNINKIKVCMETGCPVILLNLESLYESLYDALNQYYVYWSDKKFVDLGLGTHRVKCRVDDKFRLIVVAEKETVYKRFPIPLINRLEKHFLTIDTMLSPQQQNLAEKLKQWATEFIQTAESRALHQRGDMTHSTISDAFIGYHDDTCAAIILHVCGTETDVTETQILPKAKTLLLWCATPESVLRHGGKQIGKEGHQTAIDVYFKEQRHESLAEYLHFMVLTQNTQQLLAQVTTHSKLLTPYQLADIANECVTVENITLLESLTSFNTEQQFSNRIRRYLKHRNTNVPGMLIIQCDSGDTNGSLIACAKHIITDEMNKRPVAEMHPVHVVVVIHLPKMSGDKFNGFQCGQWHSVHIDNIWAAQTCLPSYREMMTKSVAKLVQEAVDKKFGCPKEYEWRERNSLDEMEIQPLQDEISSKEKSSAHQSLELSGSSSSPVLLLVDGIQLAGLSTMRVTRGVQDQKTVDIQLLILGCIQSSLSLLKDDVKNSDRTTERLTMVLEYCKSMPDFVKGVSVLLAKLLEEKEEIEWKADRWLVKQASMKDIINKAGNFRQSCQQTFEAKLVPTLASILAYLDTNQNLDLLRQPTTSWKVELFLALINSQNVMGLKHKEHQVTVKSTGRDGHLFHCAFPFSWLVSEKIDELLCSQALIRTDGDSLEQTVKLFMRTSMGNILTFNSGNYVESMLTSYLDDFVHFHYNANGQAEFKLVLDTILSAARGIATEDQTLLHGLVSVHLALRTLSKKLEIFRSINNVWHGCSDSIQGFEKEKPDHVLFQQGDMNILGLFLLIENLSPPSKSFNDETYRRMWLERVHLYRPVVEKTLSVVQNDSTSDLDTIKRTRCLWSRVMVMKLFLEHVCCPSTADSITIKHCMPLWTFLRDGADLKEVSSLEKIERFLKGCNGTAIKEINGKQEICCLCDTKIDTIPITAPCQHVYCEGCFLQTKSESRCRVCKREIPEALTQSIPQDLREEEKRAKLKDYQKRCNNFFMDVMSQLCFHGNTPPSSQLVDKLLTYITYTAAPSADRGQKDLITKEMTIFNTGLDPNPVFRSFLLQLLIRTSEERVSDNLDKYLAQADNLLGWRGQDQKMELLLLIMQCLEDNLHQEMSKLEGDEGYKFTVRCLDGAKRTMLKSEVDVDQLHGLAKARFGLSVVAMLVSKIVGNEMAGREYRPTPIVRKLIESAQGLCEDVECQWQRTYLIKQIYRYHGMDIYQALCKSQIKYLRWIPLRDDTIWKRVEGPDRYVICGKVYGRIRESITRVIIEENVDALQSVLEELDDIRHLTVYLLLAIHREVTCSHLYQVDQRHLKEMTLDLLKGFIMSCKAIRDQNLTEALLCNHVGGNTCSQLTVTEGMGVREQGIQCLVIHLMFVASNLGDRDGLLQPLMNLFRHPESCLESYLPTMPQDNYEEVKAALLAHTPRARREDTSVFYECPNGHPYVIGDCGKPWFVGKCDTCGADIGGERHKLLEGNAQHERGDCTKKGHILGPSENRVQDPVPERQMTTAECACLRLLTHFMMYLGARDSLQHIQALLKTENEIEDTPDFIWKHILKDIQDLEKCLGRSLDDVMIFVHTIIERIMKNSPSVNQSDRDELMYLRTDRDELMYLRTKKARADWEQHFCAAIIRPVLQSLDDSVKNGNQCLMEDKRTGGDPLLCLMYELGPQTGHRNGEGLHEVDRVWRYRTPVTINHFKQQFEVQFSAPHGQHGVLTLFLREETHLKAMKYIPGILKLQKALYRMYFHDLDRVKSSEITIGQALREASTDTVKHIQYFMKAWDIVRQALRQYPCPTDNGRMQVPPEFCQGPITNSSPVSVLIPSTRGAGLCCYAMLHFLMKKQNDFLDAYTRITKRELVSIAEVEPENITKAHLISFDDQADIHPLVLANCQYSFEIGKGTKIEYDFGNFERQFIDRFVVSKSRICLGKLSKMDVILELNRLTNTEVFNTLNDRIKQVALNPAVKMQIASELVSLPTICKSLQNIDIAIGFLKAARGSEERSLDEFMEKVLHMETTIQSSKARQVCELQHVKDLWLLLSLEKSKRMADHLQPIQSIFENVMQEFFEDIPPDSTYDTFVRDMPIEQLSRFVEFFHEYIVLFLSSQERSDDESFKRLQENRLKDWILTYAENPEFDWNVLLKDMPDDIANKHCVNAWLTSYNILKEKLARKTVL